MADDAGIRTTFRDDQEAVDRIERFDELIASRPAPVLYVGELPGDR
jgi:hypothetical protein